MQAAKRYLHRVAKPPLCPVIVTLALCARSLASAVALGKLRKAWGVQAGPPEWDQHGSPDLHAARRVSASGTRVSVICTCASFTPGSGVSSHQLCQGHSAHDPFWSLLTCETGPPLPPHRRPAPAPPGRETISGQFLPLSPQHLEKSLAHGRCSRGVCG